MERVATKYVVAPIRVRPAAITPTRPKVALLGRRLEICQEDEDYSIAPEMPALP